MNNQLVFWWHAFVDRTRELRFRTSVVDEANVANLKVNEELGAMTRVQHVVAPPRTRTHTVIKTTPRIPDPAEIAEVDGFGRDPETPQHEGMQRWCCLAPAQPFGGAHERARWRRAAHQGGDS
jgi:hypothetical protein